VIFTGADDQVEQTVAVPVGEPVSSFGRPSCEIAWSGASYGVVFVYEFGIRFLSFDSGLNPMGSEKLVNQVVSPIADPDIVWTGQQYGVAWADKRDNESRSEIYLARLSTTGDLLSTETRVTSAPGNRIAGPAVVESPATTMLLHPQQVATVDRYRNLLVQLG